MSTIAHGENVKPADLAIIDVVRKAAAASARLIARALNAFAEARIQRVAIEAELYYGRYKHMSKNDDDLPVLRFPIIR